MTGVRSVSIKKIGAEGHSYGDDLVVEEVPLSIRVNGDKYATLMCTPKALEHLVVGYLLSNGLINSNEELLSLDIDDVNAIASVTLAASPSLTEHDRVVTTGCGKGEIYLEVLRSCRYNASQLSVNSSDLLAQVQSFNKMSELFLKTGGVHSGAICSTTDILLFHEDIGRHNAVDKLIGEAVSCKIPLLDKMLLTSGRIASEILIKAARQSIPVIVSRSAPTALAIELAERLNITLVGFARGNRMNIYSGECRIETN